MKINKKLLTTLIVFLAMIGIVNAVATFITPLTGETLSRAGVVQNVSVLSTLNVTNCTYSGSSAKTGGSFSYTYNLTPAALTAADNVSNVSSIGTQWDLLRDADDWIFTGTCYNASVGAAAAGSETITAITVIVDLTKPTCALSGVTTLTTYNDWSSTTITATGINASSSATLYIDSSDYAMTKGSVAESQTYTYSLSAVPEQTYDFYGICSDATNTTRSSSIDDVTLDVKTSAGKRAFVASQQQQGKEVEQTGTGLSITDKSGIAGMSWNVIGWICIAIGVLLIVGGFGISPIAWLGYLLVVLGAVLIWIL